MQGPKESSVLASSLWVTYMVRCSDGTLYTGVTNDIEKRMKTHNEGKGAKYTRSRLPVTVAFTEPHPDRPSAQKAEAAIKKLTRAQKLRKVQDYAPPVRFDA